MDVRGRVSRARGQLPDDIEEPIISKVEADANAILWLAFSSDRHSPLGITDFAERYVKDRLSSLPGVSYVMIGGERRYAMRIWLDKDRLAARQLTVQDVEDALRTQNVEIPSGRIESARREFSVRTRGDLTTPEQFDQIILGSSQGYPIRLRDVGSAELGAEDDRNRVRVNGKPAVGLGVVKQSKANTLAVAIPASIISTFTIMYALGFSLDVLALLGLVLAIGLVEGNAIVVLENVHRRIERGEPLLQAALAGSREIGFAVVAPTAAMILGAVPLALAAGALAEAEKAARAAGLPAGAPLPEHVGR